MADVPRVGSTGGPLAAALLGVLGVAVLHSLYWAAGPPSRGTAGWLTPAAVRGGPAHLPAPLRPSSQPLPPWRAPLPAGGPRQPVRRPPSPPVNPAPAATRPSVLAVVLAVAVAVAVAGIAGWRAWAGRWGRPHHGTPCAMLATASPLLGHLPEDAHRHRSCIAPSHLSTGRSLRRAGRPPVSLSAAPFPDLLSAAVADLAPPGLGAALLALAAAAAVGGAAFETANAVPAGTSVGASAAERGRGYVVGLVPFFLLVPFFSRPTYRYEIVPGRIWGFEQKQGIGLGLNTAVNIRMTVIKLQEGGLWVHGPIAATAECVALVRELEAAHGPVRYIVLPTTLLEHKLWVGPFARRFPAAEVYVVQGQYSYPVNAPLPVFSGIFPTGVITAANQRELPWAAELDHTLFAPPPITPLGPFVAFTEAAFFHRPTRTLLVTDMLVHVTADILAVITKRDCLEAGDDRNFALTCLQLLDLFGTRAAAAARAARLAGRPLPEAERVALGWKRNALTALYFGYANAFDPEASWRGVADRLVVPPVLGVFVYENAPEAARRYADAVCQWNFQRVVPAHFAVGRFSPTDVQAAFDWLQPPAARPWRWWDPQRLLSGAKPGPTADGAWPAADVQLLRDVERALTGAGVIFPDAPS